MRSAVFIARYDPYQNSGERPPCTFVKSKPLESSTASIASPSRSPMRQVVAGGEAASGLVRLSAGRPIPARSVLDECWSGCGHGLNKRFIAVLPPTLLIAVGEYIAEDRNEACCACRASHGHRRQRNLLGVASSFVGRFIGGRYYSTFAMGGDLISQATRDLKRLPHDRFVQFDHLA